MPRHSLRYARAPELGRHRQPKLHAEHAGPIAKYLVEHPRCRRSEVVAFIASDLKVDIDVHTLRRFLEAYGLTILRRDRESAGEDEDAPPVLPKPEEVSFGFAEGCGGVWC